MTPPNSISIPGARAITYEAIKTSRALFAYRWVSTALLVALFWKWSYFRVFDAIYAEYPLHDPFFPAWLQSNGSLRIAYLGGSAAILMGIVTTSSRARKFYALLGLSGATVLVCHQGSFNDMTFATAWWTSLWATWLAFRLDYVEQLAPPHRAAEQDRLLRRAALLSRAICSMILLGGAMGKWTSEYWSGQVFYEIYFVDRDFWLFNALRASFDDGTLREIATWYSRQVVVVETVAGLSLWALPARYAAVIGVVIFTSIALLSNFLLFSVLLSLIALVSVGWLSGPPQRVRGLC
jgi:hypothetical protein